MNFVPPRKGGTFHFGHDGLGFAPTGRLAVTSHLLPTYARADLAFERGEGAWLTATDGTRYLDFAAGVAVNVLGHAHPALVAAVTEQAQKLWHVSNLYGIPQAERLAASGCARRASPTPCSSEIPAPRRWNARSRWRANITRSSGHPERVRFVTFEGAFHGRTLATLAAGGQKKYLEGFGPVVEGFDQVAFGDFDAVKRAVTEATAGIIIEPVMGEGGVRVVPPQFLKALRELCDQRGLLAGFRRSADRHRPHRRIVRLSAQRRDAGHHGAWQRRLAADFRSARVLRPRKPSKGMTAGTHGSTFGGNPLATSVGNAVLDVVLAPGFLDRVRKNSILLKQRLAELKDRYPGVIAEVRGEGLLIGLRAVVPNGDLVTELRNEKLLTVAAGDNVVRLLPPLIIGEEEMSAALGMIDRACARLAKSQTQKKAAG